MTIRYTCFATSLGILFLTTSGSVQLRAFDTILYILMYMLLAGSLLLCLGDDSAHFIVYTSLLAFLCLSLIALWFSADHAGTIFSDTGTWGFTPQSAPLIGLAYIFSALFLGLWSVRRRLTKVRDRIQLNEPTKTVEPTGTSTAHD